MIAIKWENGRLDFRTEGSEVTTVPLRKNAVDLRSMEVTSKSNYIYTSKLMMDNKGERHFNVRGSDKNSIDSIKYHLDKSYHCFECSAFVTKEASDYYLDNSGIWNKAYIEITADDGVLLWRTSSISRDAELQKSGLIIADTEAR